MGKTVKTVQLRQDTLLAYTEHIREAEGRSSRRCTGIARFCGLTGLPNGPGRSTAD